MSRNGISKKWEWKRISSKVQSKTEQQMNELCNSVIALPNLDKIFDELGCFNPVLYIKAYINFYFSEGICQFNNRYLQKKDSLSQYRLPRYIWVHSYLYTPVKLKHLMDL